MLINFKLNSIKIVITPLLNLDLSYFSTGLDAQIIYSNKLIWKLIRISVNKLLKLCCHFQLFVCKFL